MTEPHVIRWLAPALLAFSLLAGTWAPIVSCRPRPASAVAEPPGGHTIRLAVASEPGVPEALPRLLITLLRQELSRAGLSPAEVDQPGSLGTIAILLQIAPLPPGQVAAKPPPQKPPASKHARRMAQDRAALSSRATHPPLRLQIRSPGSGHDSLFSRRIGRCCSPRAFRAVREETRRRLSLATGRTPPPSQPLWPGTAAREDFLDDSLLAGLRWLLHDALDPGKPALSDHLQVFLILSRSARDPALRRLGGEVGPMLARRFLSRVTVPRTSDGPARLCDLAAGIHFVKAFGVHVPERLERALGSAIRRSGPDLLQREHQRSEARRLLDQLVDLYFLHRLGLPSPRPYADVIAEVRRFPFEAAPSDTAHTMDEKTYLATHALYVLSDFGRHGLPEAEVAHLVRFLEKVAKHFLALRDLETLGEVADSLRIVGRTHGDPLLRRIVLGLLLGQNADGSFGSSRDPRSYVRFHTTWTAVNGLLPHRLDGLGPKDQLIAKAWRGAGIAPAAPPPNPTR